MVALARPELVGDPVAVAKALDEWRLLWKGISPHGVVIEDLDLAPPNPVGIMVAAIVSEVCFRTYISAKQPPLLADLCRRIEDGQAMALSPAEIGAANAGAGCCLLIAYFGWGAINEESELSVNVRACIATAYAERFAGNRLKAMFGEVDGDYVLGVALSYGNRVLNDYPDWYERFPPLDGRRARIVGVEREDGLKSGNFWLQRMFSYFPPKFLFTEPQRQTLRLAREGFTDVEIAAALGVSADSIKKRWTSIYDRVKEVLPGLLPDSPGAGRGTEKRRAVLHHLRDRPEELQPFARRSGQARNKAL